MNLLPLIVGSIAVMSGLAIAALTIIFLRVNRVKNALTGIVIALIGAAIIWLSLHGNKIIYLNLNISDGQATFLLAGFVISLFILKGLLEMNEGSKVLQDNTAPASLVLKSRFRIAVAIVITLFAVISIIIFVLLASL